MKPDKKFMKQENGDLEFVPFEANNSFLKDNSNFFPSTRNNDSTPNNLNIDLPFLNNFINPNSNELYSYNKNIDYFENKELLPKSTDVLMELDLNDDEFDDLNRTNDFKESNEKHNEQKKCNPDVIFNKIKNNNPEILNTLRRYRIPYPIAKRLIKKIIRLSFRYCNYNNNNNNNNDNDYCNCNNHRE